MISFLNLEKIPIFLEVYYSFYISYSLENSFLSLGYLDFIL